MSFDQAVIESNLDAVTSERVFDALAFSLLGNALSHFVQVLCDLVNKSCPVSKSNVIDWESDE